jgi:hypothetical protein
VSIVSNTDSVGIPVTLHVVEGLGIQEINTEISIYPNPASTFFTIKNPTDKASQLEIFDATGRIVYSGILRKGSSTVEIENWAKGLYLIILHQENNRYTQQIIIE